MQRTGNFVTFLTFALSRGHGNNGQTDGFHRATEKSVAVKNNTICLVRRRCYVTEGKLVEACTRHSNGVGEKEMSVQRISSVNPSSFVVDACVPVVQKLDCLTRWTCFCWQPSSPSTLVVVHSLSLSLADSSRIMNGWRLMSSTGRGWLAVVNRRAFSSENHFFSRLRLIVLFQENENEFLVLFWWFSGHGFQHDKSPLNILVSFKQNDLLQVLLCVFFGSSLGDPFP